MHVCSRSTTKRIFLYQAEYPFEFVSSLSPFPIYSLWHHFSNFWIKWMQRTWWWEAGKFLQLDPAREQDSSYHTLKATTYLHIELPSAAYCPFEQLGFYCKNCLKLGSFTEHFSNLGHGCWLLGKCSTGSPGASWSMEQLPDPWVCIDCLYRASL